MSLLVDPAQLRNEARNGARNRDEARVRSGQEAKPKDTYYRQDYGWIMSNADVENELKVKAVHDANADDVRGQVATADKDFNTSLEKGRADINSAYDTAIAGAERPNVAGDDMVTVEVRGNSYEVPRQVALQYMESLNAGDKDAARANWFPTEAQLAESRAAIKAEEALMAAPPKGFSLPPGVGGRTAPPKMPAGFSLPGLPGLTGVGIKPPALTTAPLPPGVGRIDPVWLRSIQGLTPETATRMVISTGSSKIADQIKVGLVGVPGQLAAAQADADKQYDTSIANANTERATTLDGFNKTSATNYAAAQQLWNAEVTKASSAYGERVAGGKADYEASRARLNDSIRGMDGGLLESPTNQVNTGIR